MIDLYKRAIEIDRMNKLDAEQKHEEKSVLAMRRLIKKRCTTIFIGALDSIEQKLGYQWGSDKSLNDLTDKERLFLQLWKELRKEILDKSNNQTKMLLHELENFDIKLKTFYYGDDDE